MKDPVRVEIELVEDFKLRGGELGMAALVRVNCVAPDQDENLPHEWEKISQAAGLQFMRKLFGLVSKERNSRINWQEFSAHQAAG